MLLIPLLACRATLADERLTLTVGAMGKKPETTAEAETVVIFKAAGRAAEALSYFAGRARNEYGEIADPSRSRTSLQQAAKDIDVALQAFDRAEAVGWTQGRG